jgi:hypothetical protein
MGNNEWYTPYKYIRAAREVMGGIDLDPASCAAANQTVKAERYYTEQENGLSKPWYGRVWLNPPYGTTGIHDFKRGVHTGDSNIKLFTRKLVHSYAAGDVSQAILLCRADPTAMWFQILYGYLICFHRGNFYFHGQGNRKLKHQFGTCFVYLGKNEQKFIETFSRFGRVSRAIDEIGNKPVPLELWTA